MERVAKFSKVSYEQFKKDYTDIFVGVSEDEVKTVYDNIKLPQRATKESAGYDFYIPFEITLPPQTTVKIPTGIRCSIGWGWVLQCYPRSGLGFKYRLQLDNTVGIIDGDYYNSDNEGHIFAKITNDSICPTTYNETSTNKVLKLETGSAFMQGVFVQYGITTDDCVTTERNGGLGSTDKKLFGYSNLA